MQGVTFPLYMVSAMHYVNVVVPEKVRASGITLLSALGFGLGSLIGNFGGGFVLQYSNPFFLYKLLTIICALALAVALILKAKTKAVIEG
jgi:PPP family 3-phenylpropionic acid transporter